MTTKTPATEGQAKIRAALEHMAEVARANDWPMIHNQATVALATLDASTPIVGELTEEEIKRIAEHESEFAQHFADGLRYARDHGYLAQAPQSSPAPGVKPDGIMNEGYIEATRAHGSPAPSVIEAGDAMENMMRRLRTQRDDEGILPTGNDFNGMDGLCAAWVAAKASRPSRPSGN